MNIHSISRLLYLPFLVWAGYNIYTIYYDSLDSGMMAALPFIALAVIYVSSAHLDYWWNKNNTPPLEEKMIAWFKQHLSYYNSLDAETRKKFEKRLVLYVMAREFKSVGTTELKEVPFDIKNIIASQGVRLCLGLDDYLIKDLDRIYLYKHPFPSPRFQHLHTMESEIEDGVIILSLEQALPGIIAPRTNYNIALHCYAEAFTHLFPLINFPDVGMHSWQKIENIEGIDRERILLTTGFDQLDLLPIHIVAFFEFSEDYKKNFEPEYFAFCKIFNQIPDQWHTQNLA